MDEQILLILLIVGIFLLVVSLLLLILLLVKSKKANQKPEDVVALGALMGLLQNDLKGLKENIDRNLKLVVQTEMQKISEQQIKHVTSNNLQLDNFRTVFTKSIEEKINTLTTGVQTSLDKMNEKVEEKLSAGFKSTTDNVAQLVESLTKVEEARKQVESLSGQVSELSSILSNDKQRGRFGEFTLERILENVFGETNGLYALQYQINDGDGYVKPDAVVFLPAPYHLVAIDAKFPFVQYENIFDGKGNETEIKGFVSAVKKQIDEVSKKYIIVSKTAQQAVMFIPNDGMYAYINAHTPELFQYASNKRVVLASPATLQPLLVSIRGLLVEYKRSEQLEILNAALKKLGDEFKRLAERWSSLNSNLNSVYKKSKEFDVTVNKITKRFDDINESQIEVKDSDDLID